MHKSIKTLEALRINALSNQDAGEYFKLCNELGLEDIEDMYLYERGQIIEILETKYDIAKVAVVALSRFYEKEIGEKISKKEIMDKLSDIKSVGYFVKPHSTMKIGQLWDYLNVLRGEISREARQFCPSVLEKIIDKNNQRRNDAQDCR